VSKEALPAKAGGPMLSG